ncbi:MAG: NDP-sugar synthase [Vicingaceae bacterium]
MKKIEHAIIMAAGRGSRMMPLTNDIPKAMAKIGDTTLIVNGIEKIKEVLKNIHITVGYKKADLAKHVIEHDISSIINTEGKGNAWWLFNSLLKHLDQPLFVLTCDNVTDLDFEKLAEDYYQIGEPACMVVPVTPIEGLEGDYIFEKNNLIFDLNREKKSEKYCSGIQVINPAKVNQITEPVDDFYLLWKQLMKAEQLYCSNVRPSKWFTVDTLEQLEKANLT